MLKVSKIFYRFQGFKCYVCQRRQRWCLRLLRNTAYRVLLLISLMSKMSKILLYSVYRAPCPSREKAIYLSLAPCGFSGSPPCSPRRQLCLKMFWDLSNYKGDCRQDAQQSPILKCYGGGQQPSNSYISMGTKLHPPHSNRTYHKQII